MIQAPDGTKFIDLREIKDLATNIDPVDQPLNYALRLRGGRIGESEQGYVFKRDFGTKARFAAANPYPVTTRYDMPKETFFDQVNGTSHDILVDLDSASPKNTRVYVDTSVNASGAWKDMTAIYSAKLNGTPGSADKFITVDTVKDMYGAAISPFDASLWIGCVIVNVTNPNETVYGLTLHGTNQIDVDHIVGSTGLTWGDNDDLLIYMDNSLQFMYLNGDAPHIRFKPVEAQRKTTMFYGDSSTVPVARYPFQMYRRAERKYFFTAANTPIFTLPDGWYSGQGGSALCNFFAIGTGSVTDPTDVDTGSPPTVDVYDFDSTKPWLEIYQTFTAGTARAGKVVNLNFKITVLYANYQESDPIYASYLYNLDAGIQTDLFCYINFAMMNKEILGLIIYAAPFEYDSSLTAAQQTVIRQAVGPDSYILYKTFHFDRYTTVSADHPSFSPSQFNVAMSFAFDTDSTAPEDVTSTLLGSLNHAPQEKTRTIPKPLFAVRASRQQGAVDVIAPDPATLVFSNFSGAGNFEDDNYPDVRTANDSNLQKVFLTGHGEMMGLSIDFNKVLVFRKSEMEIVDMHDTGTRSVLAPRGQNILALNCVAKKSILVTDSGTYWAGSGHLYFFPKGDGNPQPINPLWKNWYDGTLKNSAGNSYMTDTERANILAGYDPVFREVWFQMYAKKEDDSGYEYVQWRYSEISGKWNQRVLGNAQKALAFSRRSDNTMSILTSAALYKYPNMDGVGRYKDFVATDDTGGYGIAMRLMFNVGGINKIVRNTVFWGLIMDHYGVTVGTEKVNINFYANRETSPFHSSPYQVLIGTKMDYAALGEPIGEVFALRVDLDVSSSDIDNVKEFDIFGMKLGFIDTNLIGI